MANTVLRQSDKFPVGTSVGAYPISNWAQHQLPPTGAPQGAAAETKTVASDGTLTYTTLSPEVAYVAYAQVSGAHRYVNFVGAGDPDEIGDLPPTVSDAGRVDAPGAGAVIAEIPAPGAGTYDIRVEAEISGSLVAMDASNLRLRRGTTVIGEVLGTPQASGAEQLFKRIPVGAGESINVIANAAGTAGTNYYAAIQAERVA